LNADKKAYHVFSLCEVLMENSSTSLSCFYPLSEVYNFLFMLIKYSKQVICLFHENTRTIIMKHSLKILELCPLLLFDRTFMLHIAFL